MLQGHLSSGFQLSINTNQPAQCKLLTIALTFDVLARRGDEHAFDILQMLIHRLVLSGPEVIKLFSFSIQLRQKFILLIVGILTFISRIKYRLWSLNIFGLF